MREPSRRLLCLVDSVLRGDTLVQYAACLSGLSSSSSFAEGGSRWHNSIPITLVERVLPFTSSCRYVRDPFYSFFALPQIGVDDLESEILLIVGSKVDEYHRWEAVGAVCGEGE